MKNRKFAIVHHDNEGIPLLKTTEMLENEISDADIAQNLISELENQGNVVFLIYEILKKPKLEDREKLTKFGVFEIPGDAKIIYCDESKMF